MLLEISLVFALLLFVWVAVTFRRWKRTLLNSLKMGSRIAETSLGAFEYALHGEGPVLLMLHGGPGGYDQGLLDMEMWVEEGFSVLSVSRSGYLRTPISTAASFEEQADALIALLNILRIERVFVLGASAGGPVALNLALQHPERVGALILVAAVSKKYIVRESQSKSLLGRVFLSSTAADVGVWMYDILTRRWPTLSLKLMFKENVDLDSEGVNSYVKMVMAIPEQISWYKRFIRTTCPMSSRMPGLDNDLMQLERVSFTHLDSIHCPTLVIHGTADMDVSFDNGEYTAAAIPNARLLPLANVGHVVWLGDHVTRMNSEMITFLREASNEQQ